MVSTCALDFVAFTDTVTVFEKKNAFSHKNVSFILPPQGDFNDSFVNE